MSEKDQHLIVCSRIFFQREQGGGSGEGGGGGNGESMVVVLFVLKLLVANMSDFVRER